MLDLSQIQRAVRYEGAISRRLFLSYAASLAAIPWLADSAEGIVRRPRFQDSPFSLGVASGDPDHQSVVLWTKLAPKPLEPGGGLRNEPIEVQWEIAEDEGLKTVVKSGSVFARPLLGHTVHIDAEGLKPDRWYWYRFRSGGADSPIGRTRTLPDPSARPERLRFAFASCQHYEAGLFTAYERMAQDDLDLLIHLGDYIYEGPGRDGGIRKHVGPKLFTLDDYRIRYSQYRTDAHLSRIHARCPWLVTWDDHEFENNYAADISERPAADPAEFLIHRTNAYQAYYEMMPLRRSSIPRGPDMQLYRSAKFGRLAGFFVLDTRQYRTDQQNGDRHSPLNDAALSPQNSLLGKRQRDWLESSLAGSGGIWNILAQQVMMGMVGFPGGMGKNYSMDQWPGYAHERMNLVKFMADRRISNPVVLTGDIHSNWVNELRVDDRKPETPIVASEFVGTSITSGGNGVDKPVGLEALMAENPCVKFLNRQRGYVRCTVTPAAWQSDYVVVEDITKPGGPSRLRASFTIESGSPGVKAS